jgi:hypothetical protein
MEGFMASRPFRSLFGTLAALALTAALPAAAQQPGVGYDPQARGFRSTSYQLDTLTSPYLHHASDFTAHPDLVGKSPNPYHLELGDPAVRGAFESRYGAFTAGSRFKRWIGPGNEVKFLVREALQWYFTTYPERLGGDTRGHNGEPTEVEITDVQAFGDREIWERYFTEVLPGFSPERRVTICDPSKPAGDGQETDPFWGLQYYFHNRAQAPLAVSPPLPPGLACQGQ